MQQKRLILALLLSTAILFLWSYLVPVPVKPPPQNNSPAPAATGQATVTPSQAAENRASQPKQTGVAATPLAETTRRIVVVKTPLYEARLDNRGAEVISWIVKKNKDSGREIYSVAGDKKNHVPLELVSQEGLKRGEAPLQLETGESALDGILASSNYKIDGASGGGDVELNLAGTDQKRVTFLLNDKTTGLDVVKTITFSADRYSTDLEITAKRGDQVLPQTKLKIGPSIGDQGVKRFSFYSVAPEGVAFVGNKQERHAAAAINSNKKTPDHLAIPGALDLAGVGDTYFAMVAVPAKRTEGLEYRTVQYDAETNGKPDKRYLITALVPILADGSKTQVYAGPKDHYLLTGTSHQISETVGRTVDLEGLIDYGWFSWLSRPLAVPILRSIKWLRDLTGSYGIAIILFTIVIYSLFFPLKWRSSKAMKKAQKLAPRMKELQEKIKGMKQTDPRLKELQVEQLRLMKEGNPLGGCLPLLIQMPFLFALYRAITISLDFRQAGFL